MNECLYFVAKQFAIAYIHLHFQRRKSMLLNQIGFYDTTYQIPIFQNIVKNKNHHILSAKIFLDLLF